MQSGVELTSHVMNRFLSDIHQQVDDNIDADRYPQGEAVLAPQWAVQSKSIFNTLINYADRLAQVHELLADETSRALFLDLLAYRLAGPRHVKLPMNGPLHWEARAQGQASVRAPSDPALCAQFGALSRCEMPFAGKFVKLDCSPLAAAWTFFIKQYFFERDGVRVAPELDDVIIDGGACMGDSALAFAAACGVDGHVHAFDPCAGHLDLMRHNLAINPWARATVHAYGLSDRDCDAAPLPVAGISPGITVRHVGLAENVPLRRLDSLVQGGEIPRVDFIKLDIEGSELAALMGAQGTIRAFKPRLAISLYHRPDDLFEIPLFLRDLGLGYSFYLDHYTIFSEETILYAVCQ